MKFDGMRLDEAIARVLCFTHGADPDSSLGGDGQNFLWHEWLLEARAAISAMDCYQANSEWFPDDWRVTDEMPL
jgi:hypothetical protein